MKKTMISTHKNDVIPFNQHELSAIHLPKSEIANIIKQRMNQKGTSIITRQSTPSSSDEKR